MSFLSSVLSSALCCCPPLITGGKIFDSWVHDDQVKNKGPKNTLTGQLLQDSIDLQETLP